MKHLLRIYNTIDLYLNNLAPYLLAFSIFLLHIPYYEIPLLNTYILARLITILLFGYLSISYFFQKERGKLNKNITIKLLVLFTFTTGLSIITSESISAFISNYEDIVLSTLFYSNCYLLLSKNYPVVFKYIVIAFIASTFVSVLDEFFLLLNPHIYLQIAKYILHPNQYEFIQSSTFRGRLFVNRFNEIFLPLMFVLLIHGNKLRRILLSVCIFFIGILALFSGWRIRLAAVFVGLLSAPVLLMYNLKKKILIISISIIVLICMVMASDFVMREITGYSTVGRLILEDDADVTALTVRLGFFGKAIELFKSSPLIGVGLGQYSLLGDRPYENYYSLFIEREIEAELLSVGPHNIFFHLLAETGILGFTAFLILILYFIYSDWHTWRLKGNNPFSISFILGFWILFSFALFHSEFGFQFYALLWTFRAINETEE